ncbi:DUF6461 domain-containing protein [Streptosporangium sp. NPDC003464]
MSEGRTPYDVLDEYGLDDDYFGFHAAWVEGVDAHEAARRMRADLDTAAECNIHDVHEHTGDAGERDGIVLIGQAGSWVLILQLRGWDCLRDRALSIASSGGGRAVAIGWNADGDEQLIYASDGRILTYMDFSPSSRRGGANRHALDGYLDGLSFVDGPDTEANIATALILIERITGRGLDQEWLESSNTCYVIPDGSW